MNQYLKCIYCYLKRFRLKGFVTCIPHNDLNYVRVLAYGVAMWQHGLPYTFSQIGFKAEAQSEKKIP